MDQQAKKPWESKTIILNAILGLAALIAAVNPQASEAVKSFVSQNAAQIGMFWSVLGIILRMVTKDRVSLGD